MYRFRFFRAFSQQRAEVLAATSFEPVKLHPAVQRLLEIVRSGQVSSRPQDLRSKWALWGYVLKGLRELIVENILWNALNAFIVLGSVLIAREVFQAKASLAVGLTLSGVYLLLKVLQALIEYFNSCRRLQVHRGVQLSLYRLLNDKLADIAPRGRARFSKGQLKTLVGSDVESIEDFLSASLQQWVPLAVSVVVIVPALWLVSGWVGLLALGASLLLIPISIVGALFVDRFQTKAQAEQDQLTTLIGEWVKNIRLVRFLGWGQRFEEDINAKMSRYIWMAALKHAAVIVVWAFSFSWQMVPLLVIFGFSFLQPTPLNLVEVFSSFWLLDFLLTQIQYIPYSLSLYGAAAAGTTRVLELLRQPNLDDSLERVEEHAPKLAEPLALFLRDVSVVYDGKHALRNVSLSLSLSQRTAIVGSVGSGKTTLVEALIGELPLSAGSIEVEFEGGVRGSLWRRDVYANLRRRIAYSPQQPFLSNNSMALNIDLSGQRTREEIDQAVMASQLTEDIALLPQGLSEEVGESGINLSGGQKQRVSLARAFLSQRSILVLDDPLSAVDTETERALMDEILSRSKGLMLVSHRLAELERCDRVVVLEDGQVVEDGDPRKLARLPESHFRRFLDAVEEHEH